MNFLFLPDKIRKQLMDVFSKSLPLAILRLNKCADGSNGEGFIVAGSEKVYLFSRKVGEAAYTMKETSLDKITNLKISKGSLDSFLEFETEGNKFSLSFAPFEERYVKPLIEKWQKLEDGLEKLHSEAVAASLSPKPESNDMSSVTGKETTVGKKLSPAAVFAASLMFIAASDNKMAEAEDYFINRKFATDKASLDEGMAFYNNYSFEDLLKLLPSLSSQQKLCILANLIELSMVDDVFGSLQQEMLWNFSKAGDIRENEYISLRDTFIIKNRTSILYDK